MALSPGPLSCLITTEFADFILSMGVVQGPTIIKRGFTVLEIRQNRVLGYTLILQQFVTVTII